MTDEEAKKFEENIDKIRDKVRNKTEEEMMADINKHLENVKPLYKRRVWKKGKRNLVYKPYPPDDYHKRQ